MRDDGQLPMEIQMKPRLLMFALILVPIFLLIPAASAQGAAAQPKSAPSTFTKKTVVYVSDFELDAQNVDVDQGGPVSQVRPGILERPRKREQQDPEYQAKKLVDLMATSLVKDLQKAGYNAQRLATGDVTPSSGAWVHGVFTEVDEGSRLRRAIIGSGSGQATMDLYVTVTDLSRPEQPLYQSPESDASAKKAGAVITMNPYVAAAKFVMEKNAPEKTDKKMASEISAQVITQLAQHELAPATK
jgi:hypothetical protein